MGQRGLLWLLPDIERPRIRVLVLRNDSPVSRLLETLQAVLPSARFTSWRGGHPRSVQVVAELETERIGFCVCQSPLHYPRHWLPLIFACQRGVVQRGFLLHEEPEASLKASRVVTMPLTAFLADPVRWIHGTAGQASRRAAVRQFNRERLAPRLAAIYAGHVLSGALPPGSPAR